MKKILVSICLFFCSMSVYADTSTSSSLANQLHAAGNAIQAYNQTNTVVTTQSQTTQIPPGLAKKGKVPPGLAKKNKIPNGWNKKNKSQNQLSQNSKTPTVGSLVDKVLSN